MKLELCAFSGFKIYPAKGSTFVRSDSKIFKFISAKCESYFLQRLNPRKIKWTVVYRRMHKKGIAEEMAKRRSKKTVKTQRAIIGVSWDAIKAKAMQAPEVRAEQRQQAIAQEKAKKKEAQAAKQALKVKQD